MLGAGRVLALFRSIHQVTAAKLAIQEAGGRVELVPVPRQLSSDCGMALLLDPAEAPRLLDLLEDEGLAPVGLYVRNPETGAYEPWAGPPGGS